MWTLVLCTLVALSLVERIVALPDLARAEELRKKFWPAV